MLTSTFCHLPGVGDKKERLLWAEGVLTWGDALLVPKSPATWRPILEESLRQFGARNPDYFSSVLSANQQWRLYHDFQDSCAFLDIETTGLGQSADVTTVVVYDGRTIRHYIRGQNLDRLGAELAPYRVVVTYNGKSFDGPILERSLGVRLPPAHIDLRYVLAALGLKGGLKGVERQLRIERPGMEEVDGFVAVMLWHDYRRGNIKALETLLAYNTLDVLNLHRLVVHAHNANLKKTPFDERRSLPAPVLPEVPFRPDAATIARLTGARTGGFR